MALTGMTNKTITRMYDTREHALAAVRDLEAAGFSHEDVGIVANNADQHFGVRADKGAAAHHAHHGSGAGIGATIGTLIGGGAGLAAGLGAIAIPGIGPIVAAGALVAALAGAGTGAAAGGLIGSLTAAGVSEEEAPVYAEGMRRGGSIVTVRTSEARENEAKDILNRHHPVNIGEREADYRADGWHGYEDHARAAAPGEPASDPSPTAGAPGEDAAPGTTLHDRRI